MNTATASDEKDIYQLDVLMEETRSLAAKYRAATGQTLPVSHDLACYDAMRILGLSAPLSPEAGIDAIKVTEKGQDKFVIKGRVQFSNAKGKQQRIGQLNLDADWQVVILVLMDDDYLPTTILASDKARISEVLAEKTANKRGAMTVAQFRRLADTVWQAEDDVQDRTENTE